MSIYLQQLLPKVVIHRTEVAKKKWKLRARFSPLKENCEHQTKISTKRDKDGFSPAVFRSRLEQKTFVTECFVCCVCALFSMAKSMSRMGSSVRFYCHNMMIFRRGVIGQFHCKLLISSEIAKASSSSRYHNGFGTPFADLDPPTKLSF